MRITDIRTTGVAVPLSRVFRGGTYEITSRCTIITEVLTDAGIRGCTYAGDERRRQHDILRTIEARLKPLLIGQDPLDNERLWAHMFQETIPHGDRATILQAIAAVDIALWDIKGKAAGLPVHKLLGGYHDRLPAIVIGGYYEDEKGMDGLINEMMSYRDQGYAGVKMKVGRVDVREDAERVREVRHAVGEQFLIACDANQAWAPEQAIRFCRLVEAFQVRWLEEPCHWYNDLAGMRRVRERTGVPVTAGQSEITKYGCEALVQGGAVDILNVDVSHAGGITEWRKIAAMAEMAGVAMAHHEEPHISQHCMGAIKLGLYPEYFSEARDPIGWNLPKNPPIFKDGCVSLSQAPGFGLELSEAFITQHRVS
ncbi:MAG TPA: mandelate racemase/muconate lactonizing enzyme family protein [Candidatus Tectomicrobia bacterium]|nr:mandelate racemase/muconate lactonizing enzyme family protein [Candidatus Tectomicrobia bacterium]